MRQGVGYICRLKGLQFGVGLSKLEVGMLILFIQEMWVEEMVRGLEDFFLIYFKFRVIGLSIGFYFIK